MRVVEENQDMPHTRAHERGLCVRERGIGLISHAVVSCLSEKAAHAGKNSTPFLFLLKTADSEPVRTLPPAKQGSGAASLDHASYPLSRLQVLYLSHHTLGPLERSGSLHLQPKPCDLRS